jgi:hypothetical protein
VRPVNFVGLSNFHSLAVLPLVGLGELLVGGIVVVAPESITYTSLGKSTSTVSPVRTSCGSVGSITILVVFSIRVVLSSQMPMHIDGTHGRLEVGVGVWLEFSNIHVTYESLGYVGSGLGGNFEIDAKLVVEGELGTGTYVGIKTGVEGRFPLLGKELELFFHIRGLGDDAWINRVSRYNRFSRCWDGCSYIRLSWCWGGCSTIGDGVNILGTNSRR